MRDEHWSPDQISGRITMERPDLAVSGESIYRAVESGDLDCELPRRRKASVLLRQPDGLLRAQGQSAPGRRGTTRRAGRPRLLLPSPPPLGARDQREHERAPQGLAPERREPRRCHRRSPKGVRFAQPETGASIWSGNALGRSTIVSRCTCSENSPRNSQSSKPLPNQFLAHYLFSPTALFTSSILSGRLPPLFNL